MDIERASLERKNDVGDVSFDRQEHCPSPSAARQQLSATPDCEAEEPIVAVVRVVSTTDGTTLGV